MLLISLFFFSFGGALGFAFGRGILQVHPENIPNIPDPQKIENKSAPDLSELPAADLPSSDTAPLQTIACGKRKRGRPRKNPAGPPEAQARLVWDFDGQKQIE